MIPFAFLHRFYKWPGLVLVLAGYFLAGIYMPDFDSVSDGTALAVQVMILGGFLLIICSRQKVEDELINYQRMVSLQWAVILLIVLRLTWKIIGFIKADESWMPQWQVNSLLLFYLLIFYFHVYVKDFLTRLFSQRHEK